MKLVLLRNGEKVDWLSALKYPWIIKLNETFQRLSILLDNLFVLILTLEQMSREIRNVTLITDESAEEEELEDEYSLEKGEKEEKED